MAKNQEVMDDLSVVISLLWRLFLVVEFAAPRQLELFMSQPSQLTEI